MKNTITITCLVFSFLILYTSKPTTAKGIRVEESTGNNSPILFDKHNIYPTWGYFIEASPGVTTLQINSLSSSLWNSDTNFGYNFSAGYFRSINPWLKAKLGIGVSSFSATLTGNGEVQSPQLEDIDNDTYTEILRLNNGEHYINPTYLTVPISFELGTVNLSKIGYYFDFGLEYSYLLSDNNTTKGSYTAKGNYPQWGVTLEDVPELGFYTSRDLESSMNLNKNIYSIQGGAGITVPLSGVLIFKLGVTAHLGLNNIGKNKSTAAEITPISQQTYNFRSTYVLNPLASSNNDKTIFLGLEFGFYICKQVK